MPSYKVYWEIDIDVADDPVDAAEQAWGHMRRPDSIANVFKVVDEGSGHEVMIDLEEEHAQPLQEGGSAGR
ncbi:hypothetical protein [Hyphomicrobium sp.]|uniref:hypothetical protein n=1 Tax=Hyphomicrobium sp. TaxID=82 RepID=UPI001D5573C9|nr:hypothetical protein [Hyphomicrobium sp.]MBY0559849.1 hypothetical protein [Hyphomicrobium sp.]